MHGRPIFGALLVAAGAVLIVAGPGPLVAVVRWLLAHAGEVLLGLAVVIALVAALPRGSRKLPLSLAAAGLIVFLAQRGVSGTVLLGLVLLGLGLGFVAVRYGDQFRDDVDPVHTYWRICSSRSIVARPSVEMPQQVKLLAIGSFRTRLDLRDADTDSASTPVEIVLTCWLSRIEIAVPTAWAVLAGRVGATKHIRFDGALDSEELITDTADAEQLETLEQSAKDRAGQYGGRGVGVVIHVAGAMGAVSLARR
jgi:hypothetical protein